MVNARLSRHNDDDCFNIDGAGPAGMGEKTICKHGFFGKPLTLQAFRAPA
jgi:hypothetical protein